jgi:hypothetical protein
MRHDRSRYHLARRSPGRRREEDHRVLPALHFHEAGALFTDDVATEHQGYVVLGPFNHDRAQARESFRRFAGINVDTVCFGHGRPLLGQDTQKLRDAALADQVPDPLG